MAFGAFNPHRPQSMMSDINVTPMVDVMLVLLVIFIMAAPVLSHAVKLDLPRAQSMAQAQQADTVEIAIDAAGAVFWDGAALGDAALDARLAQAARLFPQPELQLRADRNTRYEAVATLMAAAQARGLLKIGFVTDPNLEKPHGKR